MSYLLAVRFVEQERIEGYKMGPGCAIPDHTLIKEFLRWYSHSARGKKSENGRPVMTSVVLCAERLFGGFEEKMQIKIVLEDRKEITSVSPFVDLTSVFRNGSQTNSGTVGKENIDRKRRND